MWRLALTIPPVLAAGGALAHPSLVPHAHPHGASPLLGLDVVALIALGLVAVGYGALYAVKRIRDAVTRR